MNDFRSIEDELGKAASKAASAAEGIVRPKASLEETLSDAVTSVRRAIVEQPITSVLLVGAFAFLCGLNRRS